MNTRMEILLYFLVANTLVGAITLLCQPAARKSLLDACEDLVALDWARFKEGFGMIAGIALLAFLGIITLILFKKAEKRDRQPQKP